MVIAYPITSQESKFELDCVNTSRPEFRLNYSIMRHMNPTISTGDSVEIGKAAGTSTAYPETISKLFEIPYRKAEAFYAERKFNEAVTILEPAIKTEKNNPFLLNFYAKSLYAANKRKESFKAYLNLISLIDAEETLNSDGSHNLVIIDTWFLEAYWKISTLYLEAQDYEKSIYYNRKMLDVITLGNTYYNPNMITYNISALSYLAEAYYFLKNKEANHFYVCETLKLDKNNKDVLQFLML